MDPNCDLRLTHPTEIATCNSDAKYFLELYGVAHNGFEYFYAFKDLYDHTMTANKVQYKKNSVEMFLVKSGHYVFPTSFLLVRDTGRSNLITLALLFVIYTTRIFSGPATSAANLL